jgi:YidC/Oxa1 family membrane protein insertase
MNTFKLIKNFFSEIKFFVSSLNILQDLKNHKPKIVFFSEHKSYQKYSKILIDFISLNHSEKIYYLSLDKNDKIINKKVKNYFIDARLINYIFKNLKAQNLFLTVTDLGNNLIKKTNNIDNYIYYFHSPVSTTKNYTTKAFDNYDTIMCNGQFQIDEIRARENLKKLTKKNLIPSGYFYFDYLIKNINRNINSKKILIAPSWNNQMINFINENFVKLIDVLIKKNFKVIFRPHPEHFKRSKNILKKIKNNFSQKNFEFDEDVNNFKSMEEAKCLITDSSGIAIEYILVMKRPVLYLDEYDKIHNSEFNDYSNLQTIDMKIKNNFGYLFTKKDFDKIDNIINISQNDFQKKLPLLTHFINEHFFNFGKTKDFLNSNLNKII